MAAKQVPQPAKRQTHWRRALSLDRRWDHALSKTRTAPPLDRPNRATQCVDMHIQDKTNDRLVLTDKQGDKVVGIGFACAILIVAAAFFVWEGFWTPAAVLMAGVPCALIYLKMTRIRSTVTFDRSKDSIDLTVTGRSGSGTWSWKLSDLNTAEVNRTRAEGVSDGVFRPDLLMKDGTGVPMRPYFSAGTQSWHAVAAVKLFLGQRLDDAPVGWLPPEEFDRYFKEEMPRLYK